MRDGLTAIAAFVIVALGAALAVPPLVDWTSWRDDIDMRLGDAIGLPVRSQGPIGLTLLPHPQLSISGLKLGDAGQNMADQASIERLNLSLSLPGMIKGEIRVLQTTIDGLDLTLRHDAMGRVGLPQGQPASVMANIVLDQVEISRSRLRLLSASGVERIIGPIAARLSTPALTGPWTIEAEIAGEPLRLVTGAHEAGKGLPLKLSSTTAARRIDIDGHIDFGGSSGWISPAWSGQMVLAVKDTRLVESELKPAATLLTTTLRGALSRGKFDATAVTLDLGETGRLEGSGEWNIADQGARLTLGTRRLNGEAMLDLWQAGELWHDTRASIDARAALAFLPKIEIAFSADQIGWRGEDMTDLAARATMQGEAVTLHEATAQFAGVKLMVSGNSNVAFGRASGEGSAHVRASAVSLQRLALALARLGLRAETADALSGLGSLDLAVRPSWQSNGVQLNGISASTQAGQITGMASRKAGMSDMALTFSGVDLLRLSSLSSLIPEGDAGDTVNLDLKFAGARFGDGPPGSAQLMARISSSGLWIQDFAASGFGGLSLKSLPVDSSGRIRSVLVAPDAAAVIAIAGFALPVRIQKALLARAKELSPLELNISAEPETGGTYLWQAEGKGGVAQALMLHGATAQGRAISVSADATGATAALLKLVDPLAADLTMLLPQALPESSKLSLSLPLSSRADTASAILAPLVLKMTSAGVVSQQFSASWQAAMTEQNSLSGPLRFEQASVPPVLLTGMMTAGISGLSLADLDLKAGDLTLRGGLSQGADDALEGELNFVQIALPQILALGFGASSPEPNGAWSTRRFANRVMLPRARIALMAEKLLLPGFVAAHFRSQLVIDETALRFDEVQAILADGQLSGALRLGQEGGLRSMGWRLKLLDADASLLSQTLIRGQATIMLDGGASGETPLRLVSTLGGSGTVSLNGAVLTAMSPNALGVAMADGEARGSSADFGKSFVAALQTADWPLGTAVAPLTLSAGVLRTGPVTSAGTTSMLTLNASLNLRNSMADFSVQMAPLASARRNGEAVAQASMSWRGQLNELKREIDINGIRNVLAMRELARELERVEAFQSDMRERSFFARRMRLERETRERETRERELAAREFAARELRERQAAKDEALRILGQGDASSRPMQILPVPLPSFQLPSGQAPAHRTTVP